MVFLDNSKFCVLRQQHIAAFLWTRKACVSEKRSYLRFCLWAEPITLTEVPVCKVIATGAVVGLEGLVNGLALRELWSVTQVTGEKVVTYCDADVRHAWRRIGVDPESHFHSPFAVLIFPPKVIECERQQGRYRSRFFRIDMRFGIASRSDLIRISREYFRVVLPIVQALERQTTQWKRVCVYRFVSGADQLNTY